MFDLFFSGLIPFFIGLVISVFIVARSFSGLLREREKLHPQLRKIESQLEGLHAQLPNKRQEIASLERIVPRLQKRHEKLDQYYNELQNVNRKATRAIYEEEQKKAVKGAEKIQRRGEGGL